MLPSIPDISRLQSSQEASVDKQSGEVVLSVYFQAVLHAAVVVEDLVSAYLHYYPQLDKQVLNQLTESSIPSGYLQSVGQFTVYFRLLQAVTYCEDYPVSHYILDIQSYYYVVQSRMQFVSDKNLIVAGNLSENMIYGYRLGAVNSVGIVWSNISWEIYTSDVQSVQVVEMKAMGVVKIHCNFLVGSDSGGCLVMLEGEYINNATIVLTREGDMQDVVITHLLPHPLSCYFQVLAFDIESDGSIGILPIPGTLQIMKHVIAQHCLPLSNGENSQTGTLLWIIGVSVGVLLLATVIALLIIYLARRISSKETIEMKVNEVYGIVTNDICTTPSEVYGARTDAIEMKTNDVYGITT